VLSKRQRHQLIRRIVREGRIGTQVELVWALQGFGCEVTQATISRDVRELGLERRRDELGRLHYVPPEHEERRDPEVACGHMLGEFATEVVAAQNLVVLKSEVGTAPGVGRAIDDLDHPLILGCVAGDDTVLIATRDAADAAALTAYLIKLGG
jgi:transcriptional regulator of arginine metabolism